MTLVPDDLLAYFKRSGWQPERRVALPTSVTAQIPAGHPAFQILSGFSGITVGTCGAGEECATSDIAFGFIERGYEADIWNSLLGTILVGIGTVHHNHADLYIDSTGRFFETSAVHDATCYLGASFADAMRALLRGIRSRPMLRPDQRTVTLYGDEFTSDSPEVYDYSRAV